MTTNEYTKSELMIVNAARELAGERVVFVGVGIPNIAVNLAQRTGSPDMEMVYEAGVFGARPTRLPLSIGDPCLVTGSTLACGMPDLFMYYLQGGLIDVGFLGGAQIDRYGNINTTVIGDYENPKVRLPGSGGACEIALLAKKIMIITRMQRRRFPEKVDFVTSAGFLGGDNEREKLNAPGKGPTVVVTDVGVLRFHPETHEMYLAALHPGATVDQARENVGWDLRVADELGATEPPMTEELHIIREELDPKGIYRK
ncbi:MAG: 3-oxoadipate CoA-transferase subunit B [Anaerolineales bacterium]|nr:3-oxoadipate CoA-transferase subunit B [Anaerolineales bacterium]